VAKPNFEWSAMCARRYYVLQGLGSERLAGVNETPAPQPFVALTAESYSTTKLSPRLLSTAQSSQEKNAGKVALIVIGSTARLEGLAGRGV
jgi:hypothetical protein